MKEILDQITYKPGYYFETKIPEGTLTLPVMRVVLYSACTVSGKEEWQKGRWFVVEDPTNEREIVRTAYQALFLFELHEFQEHFKFDGKTVFDPHVMNV